MAKTRKFRGEVAGTATIHAVARAAGTSVTAVSRVLNHPGRHGYSDQTERNVREACYRLNYVPNALARSLVTRNNPAIGIICETLGDLYLSSAVERIVERTAEIGRHVVTVTRPGELAWGELLNENRVGWVIAIGYYMLERSPELILPPCLNRAIIVGPRLMSWYPVRLHVTWDEQRNGELITDHLAGLGHREIALLAGIFKHPIRSISKLSAACNRARDLGLTTRWIWDEQDNPGRPDQIPGRARAMTHRIIESYPNVTAIVCRHDHQALGVYHALMEAGRRIPDDMAVISNTNLQGRLMFNPPLSGVETPLLDAVDRAMAFIANVDQEDRNNSIIDLTDRIILHERTSTTGKACLPRTGLIPNEKEPPNHEQE